MKAVLLSQVFGTRDTTFENTVVDFVVDYVVKKFPQSNRMDERHELRKIIRDAMETADHSWQDRQLPRIVGLRDSDKNRISQIKEILNQKIHPPEI